MKQHSALILRLDAALVENDVGNGRALELVLGLRESVIEHFLIGVSGLPQRK